MKLYGGIDLHSNNSVVVLIDEEDRVVYGKRLRNDLALILGELAPYRRKLSGLAAETTCNWYWLVDGLVERGREPMCFLGREISPGQQGSALARAPRCCCLFTGAG